MSSNEPDAKPTPDPSKAAERPVPEAGKKPKLDLGALDLTVERVEERISPSETNVFDK
ncbi:MAG: hypothetical protein P1V81_01180 [Planctomycetota bacterium]|nr:hypothetical protein [Planctomycetota bacterium]